MKKNNKKCSNHCKNCQCKNKLDCNNLREEEIKEQAGLTDDVEINIDDIENDNND